MLWSAVEKYTSQLVGVVISIIIARLLDPADYGVIAMLSIFMAVANAFVDSGFANALVQKQDRTDVDFSTVLYFNFSVALVVYCIFVLFAKPIAHFYNMPLLQKIIPVYCLTLIINSLGIVQRSILTINLDFRRQAYITFTATVLSGLLSIWMASKGYGVWTIVYSSVANSLVSVGMLWLTAHWKPVLVFSVQSFKSLFSFGSKLLAGAIIHIIYNNIYTLVIGKVYTPSDLGLYNKSFTLSQFPTNNISNIVTKVSYPVWCRYQDDNEKLVGLFYKYLRLITFILFPVMFGFASLARPFVHIVLTDKWIGAVPYLQIMCIAFMWIPAMQFGWDLLNVKHRSDLSLRSEVIKKIVGFTIVIICIQFNITVICIGLLVYSLCDIFIVTQYDKRIFPEITFFKVIKSLLPTICKCLIMSVSILTVTHLCANSWIQLFGGFVAGVVVYLAVSLVTKSIELKYYMDLASKYLKRK